MAVDYSKVKVKLYWDIPSAISRSLKSVLLYGQIPHEEQLVELLKGEQKTPEYIQINPMATVPALAVDDKILVQNGAILRFLGNTEPNLFELYPKDIFQRHSIDAALDFSGTSLRPSFVKSFQLIRDQIMIRKEEMTEELKQKLAENEKNIRKNLQFIEDRLLGKNGKFVGGKNLSIADFQIFQELLQHQLLRITHEKYPKIKEWKKSCENINGMKQMAVLFRQKVNPFMQDLIYKSVDQDAIWYFAIGSMTNPISLETRNLSPYVSIPGEALDYKLYFYGKQGMAEALPEVGQSFHGVLHKMSPENMDILDKMEMDLTRLNVNVKLYDGQIIVATIYSRPNVTERNSEIDKHPTERYLDIIYQGCFYFGVAQSHLDFLKNHPNQPRKKPSEYEKLEIPHDVKKMTYEEVQENKICEDGVQFLSIVNGKVIKYIKDDQAFSYAKNLREGDAGKNLEITISKTLQEPKYGSYDTIEEFTREHCAYCEDWIVNILNKPTKMFEVVALIDQKYRD